ncbi:MAG: TetR/AcrR family transcriptional regulator [Hyphomonadaceae bacterium]|jgi:AcrR family transcriptional regulator|uniref:TetR/AcrR family transcriptional regulator n=1 Tax=Aquidulcibacter sp. TaxID=2052990 RepID=UPI00345B9A88
MGRKSNFKDEDAFAAVGAALVEKGSVAIHDIVDITGISTGSLYHRFGSREGLIAATWLDAVRKFQSKFLTELMSGKPSAG